MWDEYSLYMDFSSSENPKGEACKQAQRLFATNDWIIKHSKCTEEDAVIHSSAEGDHVCRRCFELGSDQRFLSRMTHVVSDMDAARLLYWKMFATETVSERIEGLKNKVIYKRRCKNSYDNMLSWTVETLHRKVSRNHLDRIFHNFPTFLVRSTPCPFVDFFQ